MNLEPETTRRVRSSIESQHKAKLAERLDEIGRRIALHVQASLALQRDFMALRREIDSNDTTLRLPVLPPAPRKP